jgi:hypothetical protein
MSEDQEVTELVEPTFDDGVEESTTTTETAPNEVSADAGAETATPIASEQDPKSSLTNDQSTTPKTIPKDPFPIEETAKPAVTAPAAPALSPEAQAILNDPERFKRFVNLEKLQGQQANELGQVRKQLQQYEGIDPQQARAVLAEREQAAKQANLNPWNRGHNENASFNQLRARRRVDDARLARVAPEQREAVKAALEADYSPEELAQLKSYEAWRQKEEMLTPEDREDRQREIAITAARQEIQNMLQYQEQARRTHEFAAKNPDLLGKEQATLLRALDERTPRSDLAAEIVALKAQLAQALGNRGKELGVVETAKAQTAQSRQAAVVGRDSGVPRRKAANPVAEALRMAEKNPHAFNDDDAFEMLLKAHEDPDPNE